MDEYLITLWDKTVDEPYLLAYYKEEEEAKQVARNLKKHYIDDWGASGERAYEVRLHKTRRNAE